MNGWTNKETWVVSLWFGQDHIHMSDVDSTKAHIGEELDIYVRQMPSWMQDLLGVDFTLDEKINWDELKSHCEDYEEQKSKT